VPLVDSGGLRTVSGLPWFLLFRLITNLGTLFFITPLVITPTRENALALLGATGLAVGSPHGGRYE
jgi:hypothetical protein